MKTRGQIAGFVIIAMFISTIAEAQWVFVARKAMGRIKQMQSEHADVASVILEAKADNVYKKALATVSSNPKLKMLGKDDAQMTLGFAAGERKVKMKVSELGDNVSEILVSAAPAPGGESTSSLVVDRIMDVCRQVKTECHVGKD